MSSFLCFLCHSTVNADTNEDTREKYRDVVGMNLCPDSHLCYICCHVLNKLSLFKSVCLKRSLEYPVLFSEKGTLNLQRTDLDIQTCCPDDMCGQYHHRNFYTNSHHFLFSNLTEYESHQEYINKYVELADERADFDDYFNINEIIAKEPVVFVTKSIQTDDLGDDVIKEKYDDVVFEDKAVQTDIIEVFIDEDFAKENVIENHDLITSNHDVNNEIKVECEEDLNDFDKNDNTDLNVNNIKEEEGYFMDISSYPNSESAVDESAPVEESKDDFEEILKQKQNIESENNEQVAIDEKVKHKFKKIVLSLEEQRAELERKRKEKKYVEAEFKCFNCALGFLFKESYQTHMMRHEESNGEYRCPTCTLRFASQPVLLGHCATHSALYICLKCGITVRKRGRKKHERECWNSKPVEDEQVTCHLCGNMYGDANALQQHVKRFHESKTSNRSYSCNVCGKIYGNQAAVRTHMIKHINQKFACDQCASTFSSPYTLRQHKRKHEIKEGAHHCECGAVLGSRKSLLAHRRTAALHQHVFHPCPVCPRQCPTERALSLHLERVHSGTKLKQRRPPPPQAICHLCGASFKGNNKLTRHLKKLHPEPGLYDQDSLGNTL